MANNYHLLDSTVNVTAVPVSGRFLAHAHASPVERAFMAADLHRGATQLVMPTMVQAAFCTRINVTCAWWAAKRLAERAAIESGAIPLVPPVGALAKTDGKALPAPVAPSDPWQVAKGLVNEYGPGLVFDTVTAPMLA